VNSIGIGQLRYPSRLAIGYSEFFDAPGMDKNLGNNILDTGTRQVEELPHTRVWHYRDSYEDGGEKMEFRLIYRGPLPSDQPGKRSEKHVISMVDLKQKIRDYLHPQIEQYWKSHPSAKVPGGPFTAAYTPQGLSFWEYYAEQNKVISKSNHIHRFAPLLTERTYFGCAVNVLFLRRDMPNVSLVHQGDLDNRLKVLFDALRMPRISQEVQDLPQPADRNPCFCLLSDDKYIDHVSVTTDRLLTPTEPGESENDVVIVIHVIARVVNDERTFYPGK